eukprot:8693563-Pyramimonas_sp.AAC.1
MEAMRQQMEQLLQQSEELNRRPFETERLAQQVPLQRPAAAAVAPAGGVDTRLVQQPGVFDGARAEWSDWSFTFGAHAAAVSLAITRLMTAAEAKGPEPMEIPDEDLDAEQAQANGQLYYVLVMLVKGAALKKANSTPVGHGSEVWRLLQAMVSSVLRAKLPDPF